MRVLMVSAAYPPDRCGVGDYARHLARRLVARGKMELALLTAAPQSDDEGRGLQMFHAGGGRVGLADLRRAVAQFRPRLVHIQHPTRRLVSPLAPALARLLGARVVQTWHEHGVADDWAFRMMLWGLHGLLYVREDLPARLPAAVQRRLRGVPAQYVPNGKTIPGIALAEAERIALHAGNAPIVAYFGLAYPNKGLELLFDIADPARQQLLLICELDPADGYHRRILERVQSDPWRGKATVTGFLPAEKVGRLLAAADAVVFPFEEGIGPWNTSVNAALASGSLVVATSATRAGYDAERNLFLAAPGDVAGLKHGLARHLGTRRSPDTSDDWDRIAELHERFYERCA
jgi:glycosyltransferase involved in cell wall biosynthesis